ncbi:HK97 gp10 family phage protein [Paenibacillus amylolyticus]|nr:HK97 gp10 family phage protein [Paenibacillus amylolyticus]WFR64305.1 HK97 gp10 family phage protein [Paenibacillus amylolyticus]
MSMELNAGAFLKQLDLLNERALKAAKRGVQKAAEELGNESDKLAPKKKGKLRQSRRVEVETKTGLRITATVSYSAINPMKSGYQFNYALYLHEVADFDPTTAGTGRNFWSVH